MASKKTVNVITYSVLTLAGAGSFILPEELGVPTTMAEPAIQIPAAAPPSLKAEATENLAQHSEQQEENKTSKSPWQ